MIHSEAYALSRRLPENVALSHAYREAIWWTGLGLVFGLVMMRVVQSARPLEVILMTMLIFLAWALGQYPYFEFRE